METDSLVPILNKKIQELLSFSKDDNNSRKDVISHVEQLSKWLLQDRSLLQHKCLQGFLTYLWQNQDDIETRYGFVTWLKCVVGFADIQTTSAVIKGEKITFKKYLPFSLSFGSCSQKRHSEFFDKIKIFSMSKYRINFDDWFNEWQKNPNLI